MKNTFICAKCGFKNKLGEDYTKQKAVVVLRDAGMTYREIGKAVGINHPQTVKYWYERFKEN